MLDKVIKISPMNRKNVLDETVSANSVSIFILPHFFGLRLTSEKAGVEKERSPAWRQVIKRGKEYDALHTSSQKRMLKGARTLFGTGPAL